MDFVNFPQNLVYRQRERLDEFDIRNKNSLNYILESELFKLYRTLPGYKNYALSIFNTAYYVCMMALADYDPMRNFGDYLQRINEITQGNKDQTALVLSMVLMIIDAHKWKGAKVGIDNLALQIFYEIEKNDFIRYSFYEQAKTHFESRVSRTTLSPTSEFKPRTIYYKLLADNYSAEDLNNLFGTDEEKVLDFIYSLGKNEEEQNTIASFMEDQMHPFFADGWKRKAFFDYIRSHIHTKFHGEEERAISDAEFEAQQEEDAINYLLIQEAKERIPELETENKRLRGELERLNKEITEKKVPAASSPKQNNELHRIIDQQDARIKELKTENYRLKTENVALEKEKASLSNEKEKAVREKNEVIGAIERLEKEVADWKKKYLESRATAENAISKLNIKLHNVEVLKQNTTQFAGNDNQVWIDWLDADVFSERVDAEEIFKTVSNTATPHLKERPRCYVLFRVLAEIKANADKAQQKDIMKWWKYHFNCTTWVGDSSFKFTDIPQKIKDNPICKWENCGGNNNQYYYAFADTLIKEFAYNKGRGEYEIKKKYLK